MRRISGAAALAVLAVTAAALQAVGGQATAQPTRSLDRPSAADALRQHPAAALTSAGTTFTATDRITDANGATHVRMDRFYRGLPVLGGDVVVHQGAQGALRGVSTTLDRAVRVSVTPQVGRAAATGAVVRKVESTRLVVDATSGTARLAGSRRPWTRSTAPT